MRSLLFPIIRLSFTVIILFLISCKKKSPYDDQNEVTVPVSFSIKDFQVDRYRFNRLTGISNKLASNTALQSNSDGFLYFASFNSDNLVPDIKYRNDATFNIIYGNNILPNNFVNSNYSSNGFVGGKAVTIPAGTRHIIIKMSIKGITELQSFGFDAGSPNTGAKDFEISYSIDSGTSYTSIANVNQFGDLLANAKNSFVYNLKPYNISGEELWIRISPKEGIRTGLSSSFDTNAGILRMDNIYLMGTAAPLNNANSTVNKLHYHIYHKDRVDVKFEGLIENLNAPTLKLDLPLGKYYINFVSNKSNHELLFSTNGSFQNFYVGNTFSNYNAEIFGYSSEIEVKNTAQTIIELERLFSQIKIEFTDNADLSIIKSIHVTQEHDPFYYHPFNSNLENPILDQSSAIFNGDFSANKQLIFYQFMGMLSHDIPIKYRVDIYGETGIIRSFTLNSSLKNNMQVVFRGDIIKGVTRENSFEIRRNENWGDAKEESF